MDFSEKTLFPKDPFFRTRLCGGIAAILSQIAAEGSLREHFFQKSSSYNELSKLCVKYSLAGVWISASHLTMLSLGRPCCSPKQLLTRPHLFPNHTLNSGLSSEPWTLLCFGGGCFVQVLARAWMGLGGWDHLRTAAPGATACLRTQALMNLEMVRLGGFPARQA